MFSNKLCGKTAKYKSKRIYKSIPVQRHFQKATDPFIPQIFPHYILRFSSNVFFQGPLCHSGKQPQTPWHQLKCLTIGSFSMIYWRIILSEVGSFKKEYLKNLRFCLLHSNLAFKTNSLYSDTIIIHQLKRGIHLLYLVN